MFIRFEKKHCKYCQTDIVTHVGNELDASGRTLTRSESSKEKEKFKLSGESWNEGTLAESFTRSIQAGVLFIVSGKLTLSWSVYSDTSRRLEWIGLLARALTRRNIKICDSESF